jgi:outer membrane protein assembly factor BamA
MTAAATFDSRDLPAYPTRGLRVRAAARAVPGLLDVDGAFGSVRIDGSGYLTARSLPATPTLALRAGATAVLGRAPFFEGAALGGRSSLRGLSSQRFQGNAAVFGGAEVRLDLGGFTLAVPGDWGVFGLADAGRVFLEGERSRRWHGTAGGGLWFAFLDRRSTMSITLARGDRMTRMYIQGGMAY